VERQNGVVARALKVTEEVAVLHLFAERTGQQLLGGIQNALGSIVVTRLPDRQRPAAQIEQIRQGFSRQRRGCGLTQQQTKQGRVGQGTDGHRVGHVWYSLTSPADRTASNKNKKENPDCLMVAGGRGYR
jgi:hypothetical protein